MLNELGIFFTSVKGSFKIIAKWQIYARIYLLYQVFSGPKVYMHFISIRRQFLVEYTVHILAAAFHQIFFFSFFFSAFECSNSCMFNLCFLF